MIAPSADWKQRVRVMLSAGFGAEDIAVSMKCPAARVREEIRFLRAAGRLEDILNVSRAGAKERANV